MNSKLLQQSVLRNWLAMIVVLMLSACTALESKVLRGGEEDSTDTALLYYQGISRMTQAELAKERSTLAALLHSPLSHIKLAMLLGYPRTHQDLGKALSLLEGVLKSTDPSALSYHPLARLLADNYQERIRLDGQFDRQAQQLKESQRKAAELQEKLDSLAEIERTLSPRSGTGKPEGGRR